MKYKEIAVIGISGRFAFSDNVNQYRELLKNKKSAISVPPQERLNLMKQSPDNEYMKCGYLQDIASFDNDFFDISKREARLMSPEQRISLELVADTILDAGYSLENFKGANCGVYVAEGESEYNRFIEKQSSSSIIGSRGFMLSGQIGYHFDLRGENVSISSGCSSSLIALHYACQKITLGEIDTAIVGGVILEVKIPEAKKNTYDILGIMSEDYTIHSFDEKANGTVSGEGGGYVLLKSLEQAEKDGDHIYGVLLSGAVNGDGGRCTSVSMPSVEAQGAVVLKAWKDADVSKLTEIEAHGIGAPVGDAVEAQSMIDAVNQNHLAGNAIKVSTAKANIGHLFPLSGMASLIKTLVGYQYHETYPIASLETVNPLIKFEDAGLIPLREVYHWEPDAERMTGISSFGLSGCNAHVVLRNYVHTTENAEASGVLKLSARTASAFEQVKHHLLTYLNDQPSDLGNLIYTLNVGRDDYAFRSVVPVKSLAGLKNALETAKPAEVREESCKVIFAVKTENSENKDIAPFTDILPGLASHISEVTGNPDIDFKLALYQTLSEIGIKSKTLLLDKIFGTAVKFQSGKATEAELKKVIAETEINSDYSGYLKQVQSKNNGKNIVVIDFSKAKGLSSLEGAENIHVFYVQEAGEIERLIRFWYESGMAIDWKQYYRGRTYQKVSAPSYPFEKKHFWIEVTNPVKEQPVQASAPAAPTVRLPERKIFLLKSEAVKDVNISSYPYSDSAFREVFSPETADIDTDYKLAMYRRITAAGIVPDTILADKQGKAVVSFCKGRISTKRLCEASLLTADSNYQKVFDLISEYAKSYAVTVFDFGHSSVLKDHAWNGSVRIVNLFEEGAFEEYLRNPEPKYQAVTLPPTAPVPVSAPVPEPIQEAKPAPSGDKSPELLEAENFLEKTWAKAFNLDGEIGHDEDFFALGGNSLIMQSMSNEINEHFNKKFDIFEIYDYETIEKLAVKILEDD